VEREKVVTGEVVVVPRFVLPLATDSIVSRQPCETSVGTDGVRLLEGRLSRNAEWENRSQYLHHSKRGEGGGGDTT
jgi:hypothetical protein